MSESQARSEAGNIKAPIESKIQKINSGIDASKVHLEFCQRSGLIEGASDPAHRT